MPIIHAATLSNTPSNILPQPYVSSLGGNTYRYETKAGGKAAASKKRRTKKAKKNRRSRKTRYNR
jgi:hypothetical protein